MSSPAGTSVKRTRAATGEDVTLVEHAGAAVKSVPRSQLHVRPTPLRSTSRRMSEVIGVKSTTPSCSAQLERPQAAAEPSGLHPPTVVMTNGGGDEDGGGDRV